MTRSLTVSEFTALLNDFPSWDPSVLVITGAGISADSGLPTYRGVTGMYEGKDPETGLAIEEIVSGPMWMENPDLVFRHIKKIADACAEAKPNRAHLALAEMEARLSNVWVLTQNVDGLHQRAGSKNVIAMHGNAFSMECTASEGHSWAIESYKEYGDTSPRCPTCGSLARPAVVLFGEMLPETEIEKYRQHITQGHFDVVLCIGTTLMFGYISDPIEKAHDQGSMTIEVNPRPSEGFMASLFDDTVTARAAEAFQNVRFS